MKLEKNDMIAWIGYGQLAIGQPGQCITEGSVTVFGGDTAQRLWADFPRNRVELDRDCFPVQRPVQKMEVTGHKGMWQVERKIFHPGFGWIIQPAIGFSAKKDALAYIREYKLG